MLPIVTYTVSSCINCELFAFVSKLKIMCMTVKIMCVLVKMKNSTV